MSSEQRRLLLQLLKVRIKPSVRTAFLKVRLLWYCSLPQLGSNSGCLMCCRMGCINKQCMKGQCLFCLHGLSAAHSQELKFALLVNSARSNPSTHPHWDVE